MPLISVITITKGNPQGFARTHASIKAQDFKDHEWVVVDGDKEPDNGIYDAMNKGIARACGDYLIFMNAGDAFTSPNTLSQAAAYLQEGPDFVYGDALEGGHHKPARHDIAHGMITHHQAMFYRRSDRQYDTRYRIAADYKYTAQAIAEADADKIAYMPFPVCIFETGGVSQRRVAEGRAEQNAIRQELGIKAPMISSMQIAAAFLKRVAPPVYWALRSRFKTARAYDARASAKSNPATPSKKPNLKI
ncbi:MAG: glycosyltransferase [Alphaproteobacteria bacterium]|nr:glycosyltransferase [Alphaproteobacteria bacterium]